MKNPHTQTLTSRGTASLDQGAAYHAATSRFSGWNEYRFSSHILPEEEVIESNSPAGSVVRLLSSMILIFSSSFSSSVANKTGEGSGHTGIRKQHPGNTSKYWFALLSRSLCLFVAPVWWVM